MFTRLIKILAIVVGASAALPAMAQPVVHGTYYEEVSNISCQFKTGCVLMFSAVPQDTLITKVNCKIVINATNVFIYELELAVSDAAGTPNHRRQEFLPIPPAIAANSSQFYAAQASSNFLFGTGKYPTLWTSTISATDIFMNCKINGTLQ